jgi:hypothetical protein
MHASAASPIRAVSRFSSAVCPSSSPSSISPAPCRVLLGNRFEPAANRLQIRGDSSRCARASRRGQSTRARRRARAARPVRNPHRRCTAGRARRAAPPCPRVES